MNKPEEDKLVNAIIALHQEIKGMRGDMDKQLAKVNLALGEMRLSYIKLDNSFKKLDGSFNRLDDSFNKLDESFNKYAVQNDKRANNHETRIARLEDKTGARYIAREPIVKYKRTKKK